MKIKLLVLNRKPKFVIFH